MTPLHLACSARCLPLPAWPQIASICLQVGLWWPWSAAAPGLCSSLQLGAEVDALDSTGQTSLFYAATHCQAGHLLPLLIQAGGHQSKVSRHLSPRGRFKQATRRWLDGSAPGCNVGPAGGGSVTAAGGSPPAPPGAGAGRCSHSPEGGGGPHSS